MAAIVCAAHWPVLRAQAISLDDDSFLTINPLVTNPSGTSTWRFFSEVLHPSTVGGYYLPLTMTSLMLDCAMGGRPSNLLAFHRTSLVLHVLATILIVLILRQLFGATVPAGITGLAYGVHPLTVETLAWIAERKTILAAVLGFACVLSYIRFCRSPSGKWRLASIGLYALALMSKPTVVAVPLLLVLLDVWPLCRLRLRTVAEKWPFFLLALLSTVITIASQVGTMGTQPLPDASPGRLVLQICYLLLFYPGQVLWPRDVSSVRPPPEPIALSNPALLASVIGATAVIVLFAWVSRRTRGPLVGWLFYSVALAPTFGVLVWSRVIAYDNYLYFPWLGLLLLAGHGLATLWRSPPLKQPVPKAALLAAAILVTTAEFRGTRVALGHWMNNDALWGHFLDVMPNSPALREKYGVILANEERYREAILHLRWAVQLAPANGSMRHNLGKALMLEGRLTESIRELEAASALSPHEPDYARLLAVALRRSERFREAEAQFRSVLRMTPDDVDAIGHLSVLTALRGDTVQAVALARRAVKIRPLDARTHFNLGMILLRFTGPTPEVLGHLRQAIRVEPDWIQPSVELAWLLSTSRDPSMLDPEAALRLADRAVELTDARDPGVLDTQAAAQAAAGRFDRALETARGAAALAESLHADSLAREIRLRMKLYGRQTRYIDAHRPGSLIR